MSIEAINHVKKLRAGGFAQGVLLFLADCHNKDSKQCNPSRETIAEFFSAPGEPCTLKRVDRALAQLRKLGFISSKRVPCKSGVQNWYSFPGLGVTPKTGATHEMGVSPQNGIDPNLGVSPQNVEASPPNWDRGVAPKMGAETGKEIKQGKEQGIAVHAREQSASAGGAAQQAEPPDESLFEEAMLATQASEQAAEALPDPNADLPPKKRRRTQQPRVSFPETLPEDWAEAAKIARPDIDPQRVFNKLRARYAPTTTKKTLATWRREFMNWIGMEYANDNRYRNGAQKPQRTLGATDTRTIDYRGSVGRWASHTI